MNIREIDAVSDPVVSEGRVDEDRVLGEGISRVPFKNAKLLRVAGKTDLHLRVLVDKEIPDKLIGRRKSVNAFAEPGEVRGIA